MTQIWALCYRQSGSDRLEKQPTDLRQYTCYFGDRVPAAANANESAKLTTMFALKAINPI